MLRRDQIRHLERQCKHFQNDRPCIHHQAGSACRCEHYRQRGEKLLLIQLSSPQAVIESSALVLRLKADDPNRHITYLTSYPELLSEAVDEPLGLDAGSLALVQMDPFDTVVNLDMDRRACALTMQLSATEKKGFGLRNGMCTPLDADSEWTYLRRVVPRQMPAASADLVQELFLICGLEYGHEMPLLNARDDGRYRFRGEDRVVGLYTSVHDDATSLWPARQWAHLAWLFKRSGILPVVLGHTADDARNRQIAAAAQVVYRGSLDWEGIRESMAQCDVVICQDAAGLSLARALRKKTAALAAEDDHALENVVEQLCGAARDHAGGKLAGIFSAMTDLDVLMKNDRRLVEPAPHDQRQTEPLERVMSALNEVETAAGEL